ncbi:hypothetical protein [Arthrobacter pigmenti]
MTSTLPGLWVDWCEVTGADAARPSEVSMARFARQACPPRSVLDALARLVRLDKPAPAPAWPFSHCGGTTALHMLVRRGTALIDSPDTHWVVRLRVRRLLFAAVLLAPAGHGGLGLSRRRALGLRPQELAHMQPAIAQTNEPDSCPACAVRSWCGILGTNNSWSHASVRALAHQRGDHTSHRHSPDDPNRHWRDSPGLLPAIDRWGYIDLYTSMHRSSLSILIQSIATVIATPAVRGRPPDPAPKQPARHITPEEEKLILTRADELNTRIAAILDEWG